MVVVGPKYGVSVVTHIKNHTVSTAPLNIAAAWQCWSSNSSERIVWKLFGKGMRIRTLPTILLQIFWKIFLNVQVIVKSSIDPDDNFKSQDQHFYYYSTSCMTLNPYWISAGKSCLNAFTLKYLLKILKIRYELANYLKVVIFCFKSVAIIWIIVPCYWTQHFPQSHCL